jgi:hypothetical protein
VRHIVGKADFAGRVDRALIERMCSTQSSTADRTRAACGAREMWLLACNALRSPACTGASNQSSTRTRSVAVIMSGEIYNPTQRSGEADARTALIGSVNASSRSARAILEVAPRIHIVSCALHASERCSEPDQTIIAPSALAVRYSDRRSLPPARLWDQPGPVTYGHSERRRRAAFCGSATLAASSVVGSSVAVAPVPLAYNTVHTGTPYVGLKLRVGDNVLVVSWGPVVVVAWIAIPLLDPASDSNAPRPG